MSALRASPRARWRDAWATAQDRRRARPLRRRQSAMSCGRSSIRVFSLERAAIDLAGAELGKRLGREDDSLRDLELCKPAVEKRAQLLLAELRPILQMNNRNRHFAEALVGRTEHRDFGDRGTGVAFGLDLGRGDILAAANDDFL